jgi:hypothetical protein
MLAQRVVVALVAGERDQRASHQTVIGHRDQEAPSALEHAPDLVQERPRVGDVLQHLRAPDKVDLAVAERQAAVGLDHAQVGPRHVAPRALERGRR